MEKILKRISCHPYTMFLTAGISCTLSSKDSGGANTCTTCVNVFFKNYFLFMKLPNCIYPNPIIEKKNTSAMTIIPFDPICRNLNSKGNKGLLICLSEKKNEKAHHCKLKFFLIDFKWFHCKDTFTLGY